MTYPTNQEVKDAEPVDFCWQDAPHKISFGAGMVLGSMEIDKDHTLTVYTEKDVVNNVRLFLAPQPDLQAACRLALSEAYWVFEGGEFADWINTQEMPLAAAKEFEALESALKAVKEIVKADWQPIETAPKDGKKFICWNGEEMMILNQPKGHGLGNWSNRGQEWSGAAVWFPNPTHWMPLPAAPSKETNHDQHP